MTAHLPTDYWQETPDGWVRHCTCGWQTEPKPTGIQSRLAIQRHVIDEACKARGIPT